CAQAYLGEPVTCFERWRQGPEAVGELFTHTPQCSLVLYLVECCRQFDPHFRLRDVGGGNAEGNAEFYIGAVLALHIPALHLRQGTLQQSAIEPDANDLQMPRLFLSEQLTCATHIEIATADLEPCAERGGLFQRVQATLCRAGQFRVGL